MSDYPLLPILLANLLVILAATELGCWLGNRAGSRSGEHLTTLEAAIFGLLALMIGFTFAMALSRFEARRDAALSEANAIATTAQSVRLLPAPHNAEALKLLREYVQVQLDIIRAASSIAESQAGDARSNEYHEALWQQVMTGAAKAGPAVPTLVVFETLNELIKSQRTRSAVLGNRVPREVLLALYAVAAIAIAFSGYAEGLSRQPSRLLVYLTGLLVFAVIILIEDIETPGTGFITLDKLPLTDVAAIIG